ncbi:hypothetical protein BHE90_017696 [Fusarium euwallaceae]|uniref:Uncharacterized protein n=2 Tax=Fusarium solani species complex TaxID=232080 RepID=A0A430KWQ1_9HYPO|nr:hypothetical protein CDV31_017333 [Fusarium ambrosium]RTE67929.1 hypothetical protein BHE90_017696 [Fusarium euwallaceae]
MSNYKTHFAQSLGLDQNAFVSASICLDVGDQRKDECGISRKPVRSSRMPMTQPATNFCNSRWWPRKKTMNVTTESQP